MNKVYIAGAVLLTQVLLVCCGLPPCRFAHQYTADELLTNPASQLQFIGTPSPLSSPAHQFHSHVTLQHIDSYITLFQAYITAYLYI